MKVLIVLCFFVALSWSFSTARTSRSARKVRRQVHSSDEANEIAVKTIDVHQENLGPIIVDGDNSHDPFTPTLILVDSFCEYLGGHCREYCQENGIRVMDVVSPYMVECLKQQGRVVPDSLRAPYEPNDIIEWTSENELQPKNNRIENVVAAISESDSGVSTAERIQVTLGLKGNGIGSQCAFYVTLRCYVN